jgi:excinuclease UvrABC nuclease subunit
MSRPVKKPAVYRMFDADGALLYVGRSIDALQRLSSHRKVKAWWTDVATVTVTHYDDELEACRDELAAISSEQPKYNAQCRELLTCRDAQYRAAAAERRLEKRRALSGGRAA